MKKIKKYIPKFIILDTLIYSALIAILYILLSSCNLMLREWVYIVSAILILIGFTVGVIQLFLKIKRKALKISLIVIFLILLLLSSPMLCFIAAFSYMPEHVVNKEGKKYVAYVNGFLRTYVYYYDYKNFIVSGKQKRIEEYYGKGGFDPIKNKFGNERNVESTIYYDENGEIVTTTE